MPSAKRVSWAQLRVGLTACVAIVIVGVLIYLMTGSRSIFARDVDVFTYMDDAHGLTGGSSVRLNGLVVGKVGAVELSGERDNPRRIIRVTMKIDEQMIKVIPIDSIASISAENMLGTKFINLKMGKKSVMVPPGGEIDSLDTMEWDEIVQSGYNLLASLQGMMKRVNDIIGLVEAGKGSIGKLLVDEELYNRFNSLVAEFQKTATALNSGKGTIGRLLYDDKLYEEFRAPIQRVDKVLADLQEGKGTAGKFLYDPTLYNELHRDLQEIRRVIDDLNAGKGTAGKFLKSDELHNQIAGLISRIDQTVEGINTGKGTLGQLLVNPQLYQSLDNTTREINGLMKDFRANPKKFLSIKLGLF
jgi:phospholipid/cholesterol/gamma-HCH transport system substrate-binding protein